MRKYTVREKEKGKFSIDITDIVEKFIDRQIFENAEIVVEREYSDEDTRDSCMVEAVGEYQNIKNGFSVNNILNTGNNKLKIVFKNGKTIFFTGKIEL